MGLLAWKFRRELHRIRLQLQGVAEFFTEPAQRRRHDLERVALLQAASGNIPLTSKVALLLVFQPAGISDATRWTCEHLVRKGYAPLLISNAQLSQADQELLKPWVWKMVERPNFGYDFGGYRDGIWMLDQWGIDPDTLIILNDSIWFPLDANETLIDKMEANPADFVGALQLDPQRATEHIARKKRPFFGSFFLMVKRTAWVHPAFKSFWVNYRITSNKYKTIRRGERGLSHALMDAGIRCDAIYKRADLDIYFYNQSADELQTLLRDIVTIDPRLEEEIHAALSNSNGHEWREWAVNLALRATEKQNVLATAPVVSMTVFQVPYLKKAQDWNNRKALELTFQRMKDGTLPTAHPSIMSDLHRLLG